MQQQIFNMTSVLLLLASVISPIVLCLILIKIFSKKGNASLYREEKEILKEDNVKVYDKKYGKTLFEQVTVTDQRIIERDDEKKIVMIFHCGDKKKDRNSATEIWVSKKDDIVVMWDEAGKQYLNVDYRDQTGTPQPPRCYYFKQSKRLVEVFGEKRKTWY